MKVFEKDYSKYIYIYILPIYIIYIYILLSLMKVTIECILV